MAMSAHEDLYKNKGKTVDEIKFATKSSVKTDQTRHRDRLILNKRLKIDRLEEAETVLTAQEELEKVTHATKLLKQGKKVEALTMLRKCFARDPNNACNFLRNEGLQALQSCLLSYDSEVLHAAAWCAINLTAGASLSVKNLMHFSPLLIRFLQGTDPLMQELCAWTIGNLAGDSHKHRDILHQQGCIPPLIALVSSQYHLTLEERSQSVLFALINLAKDESFACIRCMQESSLFNHLDMMLRTTPATCDLCFEIGWLTNYIYGKQETYLEYEDQYNVILCSVVVKLSQVFTLEDKVHRDKLVLPYLHCLGNMIGLNPDIALTVCDDPNFLPTVFSCLTSNTEFIQKEAVWIFINFMAEPSCRVLTMCQPRFLNVFFHLCQATDDDTALNALYLLGTALKVSKWMCQYLVERGAVIVMVKLLASTNLNIMEAALDNLTDLVTATVQGKTALLDVDGFSQLQSAASSGKCFRVMDKAEYLISIIR